MKKLAKIIRILTVAPAMALVLLLILYLRSPLLFGSPVNFLLSVLFLVIFPLLAYPLQPFIKRFKDKGREGQRILAIYFAVLGYVGGCLSAFILQAPKNIWIIYLTYLFSGILILLFTKLLHFKASGHACGITGPFALLIYFGQPIGWSGIPVLALAWLSSLTMKRHTNRQLIAGSMIPIAAMEAASLLVCLF